MLSSIAGKDRRPLLLPILFTPGVCFLPRIDRRRSGIHVLTSLNGEVLTDKIAIQQEILSFYKSLMGSNAVVSNAIDLQIVRDGRLLDRNQQLQLVAPITASEIKLALFSIGDDKAPGIDGYSAKFFKSSWSIVGRDVTAAVQDFFNSGKLLKSVNTTLLTLLPKSASASTIKEYRPIACCTVLYKIISKVITARMSKVMSWLVNEEKAAFVPGRFIHDNTIMAQELVKGYGRKNSSAKCMIKLDLQKAYDSIHWGFVIDLLRAYGFPQQFVSWISCCLTTVSYQICLNGELLEPFQGKKGLRQGDPVSPYLFVLCMEYLSRLMKPLHHHSKFRFHPRCAQFNITHLTFADDLLFFSKGTLSSISALLDRFDLFSHTSGLVANRSKSEIYLSGISFVKKEEILNCTQFREGTMPFRYLGVPLSSKRLSISQYQPLFDKLLNKIHHWSSKLLTYGGRLQLIHSVLYATQNFWSQVFCLPKKVLLHIESVCRQFLWVGDATGSKKAPISWDNICRPRVEGGLNLPHLPSWNKACLIKLIWAIHNKSDKLWIKWVHVYYMKGEDNLLTVECPQDSSYMFRKLLKCRDMILQQTDGLSVLKQDKFSMRDAYKLLRPDQPQTSWKALIMNNAATPRAKFILWIALWKRLATKDRLLQFGIVVMQECVLCGQADETLNHLFFECCETKTGWNAFEMARFPQTMLPMGSGNPTDLSRSEKKISSCPSSENRSL